MQTTALRFPVPAPPWQKPTSVIRVLRRPRPRPKPMPGPAVNRPQSKWTVIVAFVLAVLLHIAPVALVEMKVDMPPVEITQTVNHDVIQKTVN